MNVRPEKPAMRLLRWAVFVLLFVAGAGASASGGNVGNVGSRLKFEALRVSQTSFIGDEPAA